MINQLNLLKASMKTSLFASCLLTLTSLFSFTVFAQTSAPIPTKPTSLLSKPSTATPTKKAQQSQARAALSSEIQKRRALAKVKSIEAAQIDNANAKLKEKK